MDVDAAQVKKTPRNKPLTNEEKVYYLKNDLCFFCHKKGHTLRFCRAKGNDKG